ncbi:uncharacterized protein N7459_008576 [Penicillium hispanicum]|uniref:uncharacterized protein n=1 Tax=Penicillium hispanicum TaxID=1080232 RepID=UPI0025419676|nr:uncharacterized protein N7459_008576 [Penicillium hispanicum]KAJ5574149.1 hypothetical protein N7459_008576 [Penicillium hispanicum]
MKHLAVQIGGLEDGRNEKTGGREESGEPRMRTRRIGGGGYCHGVAARGEAGPTHFPSIHARGNGEEIPESPELFFFHRAMLR